MIDRLGWAEGDLGGAVAFPFSDIPDGAGGTPKPFPLLGIGAEYYMDGKWDFGIEFNYHLIAFSADADVVSQPFYWDDGSVMYFTGETETDVELRMIEIPFIATYNYKPKKAIIMGAYYSRMLEGEFITVGKGIMSANKADTDNVAQGTPTYPVDYNFNDELDSYDYGLFLGYRYNYNGKLIFSTRIHVGFKSIFKKSFTNIDYEMYQVRLTL